MRDFSKYGNILLGAFVKHGRQLDVLNKKQEIIDSVLSARGVTPSSILFLGFSPVMLTIDVDNIFVSAVEDDVKDVITQFEKNITIIDIKDLEQHYKQFDCVVALDEFFTYANSEEEQKILVQLASDLAKTLIITTLRDYKNQEYKDREFSFPVAIRNGEETTVYLEHHILDFSNRAEWDTKVYELGSEMKDYGPFARRTMFFKQLAKFTKDCDAEDFLVHKNIMYKSIIKKNYEHVISIKFE